MPAFEMEMVCCSIASWMATWSFTSILSNSSMQQMPLSASISAPASTQYSPVSKSFTTVAVRPAAEEDLPEVKIARGKLEETYLSSLDLAQAGSPTTQTLMSPRREMPSPVRLATPPSSIRSMARLTSAAPYTAGAIESTSFSYMRAPGNFSLSSSTSRSWSSVSVTSSSPSSASTSPSAERWFAKKVIR